MNATRENVVELLERALRAVHKGHELAEVGRLISKAGDAVGVPGNLFELAREVRAKGFPAEADIVNMAIDVATSVDTRGEVYEHALIAIHDLAADRLDDLDGPTPEGTDEPPQPHNRLN